MTETLTPLQQLTALYMAGGYGRQSPQFAADLLADHDAETVAGKATREGASTLSSDVLDLLAAIRDAADVPLPSTGDADERAWHRVMHRRLTDLYASLSVALDPKWTFGLDFADEAAHIRKRTAGAPITYALFESSEKTAGGEQA